MAVERGEQSAPRVTPSGLVEATERLHRSLFSVAVFYAVAMAAWGTAIAPFNDYRDDHLRSIAIGAVLFVLAVLAWLWRSTLYGTLHAQRGWLLLPVLLGVAALWLDGGWRSSYYLFSYAAIPLAAVVADLRWALACALLLAAGYLGGLAIHGYDWAELKQLRDADPVVANTGGYFLAAWFFAVPVAWLGGYVARIHQVVAEPTPEGLPGSAPRRLRTASLSVREVEVAQLVAGGLTNEAIADQLVLSPRTVQSHVERAMKKTGAKNRAELAALVVQEGLLPPPPTVD